MPKKSQQLQIKETRLIAWYKWEFLRRNPEYRKDYGQFMEDFGSWFREHGYWYNQKVRWKPAELRFFLGAIAPQAKIICERWQIREPLPPLCKFKGSGSRYYNRYSEVLLPTDCSKEEAGLGWDLPQYTRSDLKKGLPESTAARYGPDPDYLVELQFDLRQSLRSLLRDAEGRIKSRKSKYDLKHSQPTAAHRRRLDRYAMYLRVWDLRKSGAKFDYIGALLFSGELRAAAQRAVDSFKRAEQLINGGYKELR